MKSIQVTALEEFGVRIALLLARSRRQCVAASQIAKQEGIPLAFVSKILFRLRQAGLLFAERGVRGGFRLAKDPAEVTLHDLTFALRSGARLTRDSFCQHFSGNRTRDCIHSQTCSMRPFWMVDLFFRQGFADALTLADFLLSEHEVQAKVGKLALALTRTWRGMYSKAPRARVSSSLTSGKPTIIKGEYFRGAQSSATLPLSGEPHTR